MNPVNPDTSRYGEKLGSKGLVRNDLIGIALESHLADLEARGVIVEVNASGQRQWAYATAVRAGKNGYQQIVVAPQVLEYMAERDGKQYVPSEPVQTDVFAPFD